MGLWRADIIIHLIILPFRLLFFVCEVPSFSSSHPPILPCPTSCDVWSVQTADQRVALCAGQLEWGSAREHRARPQRVKETVQTDKVQTFLLILTPGLMASVGIPRSLCQNCIAVCAGVFVFWASGGSLYFFWECICIVGFFF